MKRLLRNFIKDRLLYAASYFISSGLIILYFYLTAGGVEWMYPAALGMFIFIIAAAADWVKYYKFQTNLSKSVQEDFYELQPQTNEQREISECILRLSERYTGEISRIKMENTNNQHFLSQWIHNMKTPVSVIGLILQKAKQDKLAEDNIIKDIEEENDRLHSGLEQILNMIRMEEFFRDYEPEAVDLLSSLREVINGRKSQFIYSNVFPRVEVQQETALVITDDKWNKFMLDQIISNAIKYSRSDSERKEKKYVSFRIFKEGDSTLLQISDEGVGIPSHDLDRIFEPFFTGENGRRFKNSTGIGLYITSLIAEKLGHRISVESKENEGTKVTIAYITKM